MSLFCRYYFVYPNLAILNHSHHALSDIHIWLVPRPCWTLDVDFEGKTRFKKALKSGCQQLIQKFSMKKLVN